LLDGGTDTFQMGSPNAGIDLAIQATTDDTLPKGMLKQPTSGGKRTNVRGGPPGHAGGVPHGELIEARNRSEEPHKKRQLRRRTVDGHGEGPGGEGGGQKAAAGFKKIGATPLPFVSGEITQGVILWGRKMPFWSCCGAWGNGRDSATARQRAWPTICQGSCASWAPPQTASPTTPCRGRGEASVTVPLYCGQGTNRPRVGTKR